MHMSVGCTRWGPCFDPEGRALHNDASWPVPYISTYLARLHAKHKRWGTVGLWLAPLRFATCDRHHCHNLSVGNEDVAALPLRYQTVVISDPRQGYAGAMCKEQSTCRKYRRTALTLHCPSARFNRRPPFVFIARLSIQSSPPSSCCPVHRRTMCVVL